MREDFGGRPAALARNNQRAVQRGSTANGSVIFSANPADLIAQGSNGLAFGVIQPEVAFTLLEPEHDWKAKTTAVEEL